MNVFANHSHHRLHLIPMKIICLLVFFAFAVFVRPAHSHTEKAHAHGAGQLSMAFDGLKGTLRFESPADSTVGFEHEPKTQSQKKQVDETLQSLKINMASMLRFDQKLECVLTAKKIEFKLAPKTVHAETIAEFDILCEKSPLGSEVLIDFVAFFPRLKKVEVQILIDDFQKSFQVGPKAARFELK